MKLWRGESLGDGVLLPLLMMYITIRLQTPPIDALLGKARYNTVRYKYSHALDVLNSALQLYPNFLPALIEKVTVQLAKQEWEAAVETAHKYIQWGCHHH